MEVVIAFEACVIIYTSLEFWVLLQYKDHIPWYRYPHPEYKMITRPSYFYYGNPHTGVMEFLHCIKPPVFIFQMNIGIFSEYLLIPPNISVMYSGYFDKLCDQAWFDISWMRILFFIYWSWHHGEFNHDVSLFCRWVNIYPLMLPWLHVMWVWQTM